MAISDDEVYLLNNKNGAIAHKVQLGTLIRNAETGGLADDSVATAMLQDGAVTLAKMAAESVDSDQYVDGSIDAEHFAAGAVNTAALGAAAVTIAKVDPAIMLEATGTLTQANLLAIGTPITAIAAPGAGKIIIVDEVELLHTYSTTQYATGADVQLEYATSGDSIALIYDTFVTEAASSNKVIKPSTYNLDGSTGTAAGFDVTANANKAVQWNGSNFTNGHASNIVKYRIRYHVVTLLT